MSCWRRMEKISWTDKVKTKATAKEAYPTQKKGRKANWNGRILRGKPSKLSH